MSAKAPRADFALPGGRFPLNTPGRRKVAVKDAVISQRAGNISAADVATIRRKVAAHAKAKVAKARRTRGAGAMNDADADDMGY